MSGYQNLQRMNQQLQLANGQCALPPPPARQVYCNPAQFSSQDGRDYHYLVTAYGQSRPSSY